MWSGGGHLVPGTPPPTDCNNANFDYRIYLDVDQILRKSMPFKTNGSITWGTGMRQYRLDSSAPGSGPGAGKYCWGARVWSGGGLLIPGTPPLTD